MRPVLSKLAQRRGGGSRPKKLPEPFSIWKIVRGDKVSWTLTFWLCSKELTQEECRSKLLPGKKQGSRAL
jgi:hypothetical protein